MDDEESSGFSNFGKAEQVAFWTDGISDIFPRVILGDLPRAYFSRHSNDLGGSMN